MSSDLCVDTYNDELEIFEGVLYFSVFTWLFLTVAFLPKNEAREQQQHRCSFLVPCLRAMTRCFGPYRPLLEKDETKVIEAARNAGKCSSVAYVLLFLLLQTVPLLALVVGLAFFYPNCGCSDQGYCKCIGKINFIPVGSCTGVAIFLTSLFGLMSLAMLSKAARALPIIRNDASYATIMQYTGTDRVNVRRVRPYYTLDEQEETNEC